MREYPLGGVKKDETENEFGHFLNNAPACGTNSSAPAACS